MTISLNFIWPAVYVAESVYQFWFLVFLTIAIELVAVRFLAGLSWKTAAIVSVAGNIISGSVGTFVMSFAMIFWHVLFDWAMPQATFDRINWVMTYILMCLGSVVIETFSVSLFLKQTFKKLFLPMLCGNLITYAIIAMSMMKAEKESQVARTETIRYVPNISRFTLGDQNEVAFDTSWIAVKYNAEGKQLHETYTLEIFFREAADDSFGFDLRRMGADSLSDLGIEKNRKTISSEKIENEYHILIQQKNPDTAIGWRRPVVTDTVVFKKLEDNQKQ